MNEWVSEVSKGGGNEGRKQGKMLEGKRKTESQGICHYEVAKTWPLELVQKKRKEKGKMM